MENNNNLAYISIIAIVAVVGIIGLIMMVSGSKATTPGMDFSIGGENLAGDAKVYDSSSSFSANSGICSWSARCLVKTENGLILQSVSGSALNSQYSGSCSSWASSQATTACGAFGAVVEPDSFELRYSSSNVLKKIDL